MEKIYLWLCLAAIVVATAGCPSDGRPRFPGPAADAAMATDAGTLTDAGPPPSTDAGVITCAHECAIGEAPRCAGDGYQTCTTAADGCRAWSVVTACGSGQSCEEGVCRGEGCPGGCCPRCDGTRCGPGSDGCGGSCACEGGMACTEAGTCCTSQNGATACNRILTAWCDRTVRCCTAAGAPSCPAWALSTAACRGEHVAGGFDCAADSWVTAEYCREGVDACVADIPLVACTDITGGTAELPSSCR